MKDKDEIMLSKFLRLLYTNVFVSETDVNGNKSKKENSIKDYEAVIEIKGQWDREDLKRILKSLHE